MYDIHNIFSYPLEFIKPVYFLLYAECIGLHIIDVYIYLIYKKERFIIQIENSKTSDSVSFIWGSTRKKFREYAQFSTDVITNKDVTASKKIIDLYDLLDNFLIHSCNNKKYGLK